MGGSLGCVWAFSARCQRSCAFKCTSASASRSAFGVRVGVRVRAWHVHGGEAWRAAAIAAANSFEATKSSTFVCLSSVWPRRCRVTIRLGSGVGAGLPGVHVPSRKVPPPKELKGPDGVEVNPSRSSGFRVRKIGVEGLGRALLLIVYCLLFIIYCH